jgi:hypothetical protein
MRYRSQYILLLVISYYTLHAQQTRTIESSGHGLSDEASYNDAREQALKQCGIRLLSTFSEIRSGSNIESSVSRQFYLAGIATGMIVEEDTIQPAKVLPKTSKEDKAVYETRLRLKVRQLEKEDPYFQLSIKLDPERTIFRNGDQVSIQVQSTKDCFLTVFSLGADNRLYLLYPYVTQANNFLKAQSVFPISGLTMGLLAGSNEASESIIAIATKGNFPFIDFSDKNQWQKIATKEGQFLAFRVAGAATKLAEWLGTLGEDQWTIARLPYSIIK